jgi:K319-like protein/carbohydrate binding protein with CBM4/9 domain
VIRQALNAVSFHANPTGGPVYFYRNVVDQRVPTRGYRILPPDAPAPFLWRYGSDIKDVPTVEFHSYQNTFIASHALDKSSYVSHLFYTDPPGLTTSRNNLYLVLNTDVTMGHVPSGTNPAVAEGNLWYRYHPNPDPLFRTPLFLSALGKYFTLDELHAALPEWESQSQIAEPQLANFTDEYFDYASFYPNTDFRPLSGSPAEAKGVLLPADLPDDFGPALGAPDVGARPVTAPVLAVGVDAATLFPVPGVPVACAGSDQSIVDADGDGFETVKLDGSASHDPDGSLTTYAWSIKGRRVAATAATILNLPEGDHYVRLLVADNAGNVDSDAVRVRVVPLVPGDNLLACAGFEDGGCGWKGSSANVGLTNAPADVHSGSWALRILQDSAPQSVRQRVRITPGATYTVSGWLRTKAGPLPSRPATLTANVLDGSGTVLRTIVFATKAGNSPYSYHQTDPITAEPTAAVLEVVGTLDGNTLGTDAAYFDDLRIRDRNLLQNGRFEIASPSGSTIEAPGWAFGKGGRIANDPTLARSGRYVLALEPSPEYHHITQQIVHTPGRSYRVSAWLKTVGMGTAPLIQVRFLDASRAGRGAKIISNVPSEGSYRLASGIVAAAEIPAGTALLEVTIHLDHVSTGSAYLDDVLVEPIS